MVLDKKKIFSFYSPIFEKHGFQAVPELWQYRKETSNGFKAFIISISEYEEDCLVELHLGIRMDSVENFVYRYVQALPEFGPNMMTLVTSMARIQGLVFKRYSINSSESLQESYDQIAFFVNDVGLLKLDEWENLKSLNKVYNNDPYDLSLIYNSFNKAIRGLSLAKFSGNPNYQELKDKYRYMLEYKKYPPESMQFFDKLVSFLDNYSPN